MADPDKRVALVQVTGFSDHGTPLSRYTTYEVEFRLRDNSKVLCHKRYSHFRDLYKTASAANDEVRARFSCSVISVDRATRSWG